MAFLKKIANYRACFRRYYTLLIKTFLEVEKQELRGTDEAIEIEKVYRQRKYIT